MLAKQIQEQIEIWEAILDERTAEEIVNVSEMYYFILGEISGMKKVLYLMEQQEKIIEANEECKAEQEYLDLCDR